VGQAQDPGATYLRDRGAGQPTSMFATYIGKGDLLVYPFFEYYRDSDYEYSPDEFGQQLDADFRGEFRASEGLIFLAYGITDRLAVEFEAAVISARFEKARDDPTAVPAVIEESGVGDVEGQLRMRWNRETASRPEVFSYLEVVSPQNRDKLLIGTDDWEFKLGSGIIKGFSIGTFAVRVAMEYDAAESKTELGELAVEYVRQLSSVVRIYTGLEGTQDEIEWISEIQLRLSPHATLKLNNSLGVTSKATDWAPEVGVMLSFPVGR
jgi:hypothetical protein